MSDYDLGPPGDLFDCPTPEELAGYAEETLDEGIAERVRYHLEELQCEICREIYESIMLEDGLFEVFQTKIDEFKSFFGGTSMVTGFVNERRELTFPKASPIFYPCSKNGYGVIGMAINFDEHDCLVLLSQSVEGGKRILCYTDLMKARTKNMNITVDRPDGERVSRAMSDAKQGWLSFGFAASEYPKSEIGLSLNWGSEHQHQLTMTRPIDLREAALALYCTQAAPKLIPPIQPKGSMNANTLHHELYLRFPDYHKRREPEILAVILTIQNGMREAMESRELEPVLEQKKRANQLFADILDPPASMLNMSAQDEITRKKMTQMFAADAEADNVLNRLPFSNDAAAAVLSQLAYAVRRLGVGSKTN